MLGFLAGILIKYKAILLYFKRNLFLTCRWNNWIFCNTCIGIL